MRRKTDIHAPRSVAIIGTRGYPSYYGGFETAVRKLAPYLADEGWKVTVYGRKGATQHDDRQRDLRVETVQTFGSNSQSLSTLTYGLTACLHAAWKKPDVALVMNVANGFWLPLLRLRGVPTVVNVDGIEWHRDKWGRLAKTMFKMGAEFTAKFGSHLVFDAKAIRAFWRDEFKRDGTYIPYGGDPVQNLDLEPGLTSGKYVLMVARLVPENTVAEFFGAARKLATDGIDVVIVGTTGSGGTLDEQAEALDSEYPSISWLRHISDDDRLFALWQHAGAYFHGHSVGGTNPALVQAMMAGAPILARDTVYNREVLGHAGSYCEPDVKDIVRGINALLRDPGSLSDQATERSCTYFNWPDVCDAYSDVLNQVRRIETSPGLQKVTPHH